MSCCSSCLPRLNLLIMLCIGTCSAGQLPTVAYLFTQRRERHMLHRSWEAFWRTCPAEAEYHVHVHADPTFTGKKTFAANASIPKRGFEGSAIPGSIHIRRFEYTMVRARMLLLRRGETGHRQPQTHSSVLARTRPAEPHAQRSVPQLFRSRATYPTFSSSSLNPRVKRDPNLSEGRITHSKPCGAS